MLTPQQVIAKLATILHQRHLKPLGYRKTANTWILPGTWPRVINLQLNRWNSAEEASFTINLGVSIPELHVALEGLPVSPSLKEYDCDLRERLASLVHGKDQWWTATCQDDPSALADRLFTDLQTHGLPWLNRFDDYLTVAREYERKQEYFCAAIAFQLGGRPEAAASALALDVSTCNQRLWPRMKRIAEANSIPFPGS